MFSNKNGAFDIHLWVEEASWSFNNADSLIESLDLEEVSSSIVHNSSYVKAKILWVKFGSERVWEAQLLSRSNVNIVAGAREVANDTGRGWQTLWELIQSRQVSSNDGESDRFRLAVGKFEKSLGRMVVDKLHTENLGLWECSYNIDIQVGGNWVFEVLFGDLS